MVSVRIPTPFRKLSGDRDELDIEASTVCYLTATIALVVFLSVLTLGASDANADTWRGLKISPEDRCAHYDKKKQYPYPQTIELDIVAEQGGRIYGPYNGRTFASIHETDIEHIVATSEAHDSGLCAANAEKRKRFATDLLNLTLADPTLNRQEKSGKDAAEWMPEHNKCWFADRVVKVRRKYGLTIDQREVEALEPILSGCSSTDMIF